MRTCSLVLRLQTCVDRTKLRHVAVSFTHEKNLSGLGMAMVKHCGLREKDSQQLISSEKTMSEVYKKGGGLSFEFDLMKTGRLVGHHWHWAVNSDRCVRKDGAASVSVVVAWRTKDWFSFVTLRSLTQVQTPLHICTLRLENTKLVLLPK